MRSHPFLAIVAGLLAAMPAAAAAPPPALPSDPVMLALDSFFSLDEDGGRTLRFAIEDGPGGLYVYTRANTSNAHETLGGLVARADPATGRQLAQEPEPVSELGAYEHQWTHQGAPMVTLGVYAVHATYGLLRVPALLLENVDAAAGLPDEARALVLDHGTDVAIHAIPFLMEYALPEMSDHFGTWPASPGGTDTFRDYPRVYAWTVKKSSPAGEVWEGAYLERLGWRSGSGASAEPFEGAKSNEVGVASRIDEATARLAGAYVETHLRKEPGQPQRATQRITVGAANEGTGRTPLAGLEAHDARLGAQQSTYPEEQRTGLVLGAYVQGAWTPLLGTWTQAWHAPGAGGDVEQTRLSSVGPYVLGSYMPVAGVRYHGDRNPLYNWANRFVEGGTLGATTMGDWQVDVGAFAQGSFVPLAGATYADDFAGARFAHQAMVTAGVHGPLGYQPLVAATYDGERPLQVWATAWANANRADTKDWMVSVGTYAGAQHLPLIGARFANDAPGASRAVQEHYTIGVFGGSYAAFIPLLGATWDGEQQHARWATAVGTGGGLGAAVGDWDLAAGTYTLGGWQPVLGVQYRNDHGSGAAAQSFLTIGAWGPGGFEPLVGISYASSQPLVASLGNPSSLRDDARAQLTAGVFVQRTYMPLVMVENNGDSVNVGLLPPS